MIKRLSVLLFILCFAVTFQIAKAISVPGEIPEIQEQVEYQINPKYPGPREQTRITLSAFGTNIQGAEIDWFINGNLKKKGVGETFLDFTTDNVGEASNIQILIKPIDGPLLEKDITVTPQEVDMVWESNNYVPPFYKGKTLFGPQDTVRIIAVPNFIDNGFLINPTSLIYQWRVDDTVEGQASGFNKNILVYDSSILARPFSIAAEITDGQKQSTARNELILQPILPQVLMYEDHPRYGVLFNQEVTGSVTLNSQEVKVNAYPMFFGTNIKNGEDLIYEWTINGQQINVPQTQTSVVFRNTQDLIGESVITANVKHTQKVLQNTSGTMSITFTPTYNTDEVVSF